MAKRPWTSEASESFSWGFWGWGASAWKILLTWTFSELWYCLSGPWKRLISKAVTVKTNGDNKCKLRFRLRSLVGLHARSGGFAKRGIWDSGPKIASHFRAICSPGRIIIKLFKFPRKYSMENLKNKLNVYAILYYENETYYWRSITPHIDKWCPSVKGIPIVTDELTPGGERCLQSK